jgi:hypothetical protein
MIGAPSRQVVVHSPRPADEVRAILVRLLVARTTSIRAGSSRLTIEDGVVDGDAVSFTALSNDAAPLKVTGTIAAGFDGSVLLATVTAPTTLRIPAAGLTVLVALFLAADGIPLGLVALGVVAWVFLTLIVVASIEEQRLGDAEPISQWLEGALVPSALDMPRMPDANGAHGMQPEDR